jgi:hypothetical protein
MKTVYKICVANVGLTVLVVLLLVYGSDGSLSANDYIGFFGLTSLFFGPLYIIIGLLLLVFRRKIWAQGFLLSAGVLLLLGFVLCSAMQ